MARRKNDISIGQALDLMVTELKLKGKLDESRIRERWAEIMGKPIAKYTSSISLRDGKLYIKVESAPLRNELNYSRDKIKEMFNKEIGEGVVKDVIVF
jgi:predicted nucleic acid-binding Zn ribbon protein